MFPGHKVTSIYCNMYHVVYKECDDGFKLTMKFDNGAVCHVEVGTSHYIDAPRWYVCGNRGTLSIPTTGTATGISCGPRNMRSPGSEDIVYTKAGPTRDHGSPRQGHHGGNHPGSQQIRGPTTTSPTAIWPAVLDGTEELLVKPEETLRVMKIMEACFESDRTGQAILCDL